MDFVGAGPITSVTESAAAAVGSMMLLGGFAVGIRGLVLGWPRAMLEARTLDGGYLGGAVGLLVFTADIIIRYLS